MKKGRIKMMLSVFVAVAMLLSLVGCGGNTTATEAPKQDEQTVFTFALGGDVVSFDPAFAYDFTSNPVVNQVTEGLLRYNSNSELEPCLAERYENPDPVTYIYHLRKNVTFHDGTPMTADDVIFSMERIRDPQTAAYSAFMFENVDTIEKLDDYTVKVTLSKPDALYQYTVATTAGHVISKAYYEANKETFGKPDGGTMGTGAYKYVEWKTGSEVILEKNEAYWDSENMPSFDKIVYKVIPEGATIVTGLKTGQIDATIGIPVDLLPLVQEMENLSVKTAGSFSFDNFSFNTQKAPFDDVNVRKAISSAYNSQKIIDEIVKDTGFYSPAVPVPPSMWTFGREQWDNFIQNFEGYGYDMARAQEFLAQSSVPNGFTATLVTDGDPIRLNACLELKESVAQLGINLEIEKVSREELTTRLMGGERNYDMITGNFGADFPDPSANLVPLFHSKFTVDGGSNFPNYKNPEVDRLLDEQMLLTDSNKRAELMIEAVNIIAEDVPCIMIDFYNNIYVSDKNIEGYDIAPLWYWDGFVKQLRAVE